MPDRLDHAERRLAAARALLDGGFHADAISRAYYAMYHAAQALLEDENITVKTHSGLIRMIGKEFVKEGRMTQSLGEALAMVEEKREQADYSMDSDLTKEDAERSIGDAQRFLQKARELLNKTETMDKTSELP